MSTAHTTGHMARGALLAESVLNCKFLVGRYLAGFNEVTCVRGTPDLPNHMAWSLGHLALTMHQAAGLIAGTGSAGLPTSDFAHGPEQDATRGSRDKGCFGSEAVAMGSRPEDRHDRYPRLERCVEIFNSACDRLAGVVREVPDERLDAMVRWGTGELPAWSLVIRMVFHNGFHTGQVADLRRALGFKSIFV